MMSSCHTDDKLHQQATQRVNRNEHRNTQSKAFLEVDKAALTLTEGNNYVASVKNLWLAKTLTLEPCMTLRCRHLCRPMFIPDNGAVYTSFFWGGGRSVTYVNQIHRVNPYIYGNSISTFSWKESWHRKMWIFVPKTVSFYGAFRRIFALHNACDGKSHVV